MTNNVCLPLWKPRHSSKAHEWWLVKTPCQKRCKHFYIKLINTNNYITKFCLFISAFSSALTPLRSWAKIDCSTYFCPLSVGKKHHAHSTVMTRLRDARNITISFLHMWKCITLTVHLFAQWAECVGTTVIKIAPLAPNLLGAFGISILSSCYTEGG